MVAINSFQLKEFLRIPYLRSPLVMHSVQHESSSNSCSFWSILPCDVSWRRCSLESGGFVVQPSQGRKSLGRAKRFAQGYVMSKFESRAWRPEHGSGWTVHASPHRADAAVPDSCSRSMPPSSGVVLSAGRFTPALPRELFFLHESGIGTFSLTSGFCVVRISYRSHLSAAPLRPALISGFQAPRSVAV